MWCGGVGHIEQTCYSKINRAPRGGDTGVPRGRGRGDGAAGRGGYGRYGDGDQEEQGHVEVLVGEVNMGMGDKDGEDKEWVCDTGANYHTYGDDSLFDTLEDIPSTFHV